jgi:outer membrane protein assembly factor BamA
MRHLLASLLFLLSMVVLRGQVVTKRSITGLKRTQETAIERVLSPLVGDTLSSERLSANLNRLSNLPAITQVSYRLDTLPNGNLHLTYNLTEGISRYPVALLGGLQNNFWWEAGYADQNWRGMGGSLSAVFRQTDGRLGGRVAYGQPYIRQSQWGYQIQVERYASREPLYFGDQQIDYFYANHNIGAGLLYHFSPESALQFGGVYFVEDYEKANPDQLPGPNARQERKQLLKLAYQLRQLYWHPLQPAGFEVNVSSELVLQKGVADPFYLLRANWKQFYPLGSKGLLATRLSAGYSANKNTPFAPFVVDSRINIRGAGNRVDRGTASLVLNVEYRHLIFDKPWLRIQAVAFADAGSWRNPGGEINDLLQFENTKYFAGLGLRLAVFEAQQFVLRADYGYGLQPTGRRGIVLGLGQYF